MAVQEIDIGKLKVHPKNIRKQYEGIDELAASIKEKGIMQNLTVVPDPETKGFYLVVIGNRRLTAAKEAGLKTVPCAIVEDMDDKDQVTTMLTENMNRKDLKVYEESAAMQMCLKDFGFSTEEIAKETGLSQTTVNHRLNVAKLNPKVLQKKVEDPDFQMTLTDLQSLEKVEDIKTRNKILKEASNSAELANKARQAAAQEKKEKNEKILIEMLTKKGITQAPDEAKNDWSHKKFKSVQSYRLSENLPKTIKIDGGMKDRELFFYSEYGRITICEKVKKSKEKKELTPAEQAEKEKDRAKRELKAKYKELMEDMRQFIVEIIDGKVKPVKDTEKIEDQLWNLIMHSSVYPDFRKVEELLLGKDLWAKDVEDEDRENVANKAQEVPRLYQMMAVCHQAMKQADPMTYRGEYNEGFGEKMKMFFDSLHEYGYTYPDEESKQIADGTHEKYVKPVENVMPEPEGGEDID